MQVENAFAGPDGSLETVRQFLGSHTSLAQAIIGYQTVQGSHSLSLLLTQTQLNTTDSLGGNNASTVPQPAAYLTDDNVPGPMLSVKQAAVLGHSCHLV